MHILISGGAGFIGSNLTDSLLNKGHQVTCVDTFLTSSRNNIQHLLPNKKFKLLEHDVIKPFIINEHVDAVFHLASPASPNHHSSISYHSLPMETMLVNTTGTINMLEIAQQHNARFLFSSTSEIYGDPLEHPQKETYRGNVSTIGPRSVYDEAKRFGETIVAYYVRSKKIDGRIARIFNTYGPRMHKDDLRMMVTFILQALQNKPITIFGDGLQTRSVCFVSDTVEGLEKLMFTDTIAGSVINIGAIEERTVLEYAQIIKQLTNSTSEIIFSEKLPEDDPKKRKPDITKAQQILHWEPHISLKEGLGKMITYCQSLNL